jgi:uncharacterized protein YjgD (DUF1641 family)
MAVAVDFRTFTPADSRGDLIRRVEQAPMEHAQAILAAYDLLERLHEKGVLDILNGLLSAGDTVVNHVVNVISSKELVSALRMGLIIFNLVKEIDPDQLAAVIADSGSKPPSMLAIAKQAMSADARRGMATAVGLLNVLGAALEKAKGEEHG